MRTANGFAVVTYPATLLVRRGDGQGSLFPGYKTVRRAAVT